ncbi:hypothetical protein [Streptomyces cavernicola]|uniref:DUF1876 domain-containing protein n=1 Tax=Streptomyces cavernicola TaxID=3043613 RepID=A0ABT6SC24_9ACTN|nr:hypothetical protein [Streptomyces sp. B-S-A6]MDI3405745.1 hypothetical protein [Streptomyces sp. B-S-A6]
MTTTPGHPPRLLPWQHDGKPCYLSTDGGPDSYVSRLADEMEAVQLDMGTEVFEGARAVLDDPASTPSQLRYAGLRLAECLVDAKRVAESRGARITAPQECAGTRRDDRGPSLPAEAFG